MDFAVRTGTALVVAAAALSLGCAAPGADEQVPARYAALHGRYAIDRFSVLEVEATADLVAVVPPFWTAKPYFVSDDGVRFRMELPSPRPHRVVTFGDFEAGAPRSLRLSEIDRRYDDQTFHRLAVDEPTVVGLLLAGESGAAAKLALEGDADPELLADFALASLLSYRSRATELESFLLHLTAVHPRHQRLLALHAYSLVAAGDRRRALVRFREADRLDPGNAIIDEGLRRLQLEEPSAGEGYRRILPFSLRAAYALPSDDEIRLVRQDWAGRSLDVRGLRRVARHTVSLGEHHYDVHVLRHLVHGDEHFGAVFLPSATDPQGPLPIVVDVRGVNPTYSPLDLSSGTKTLRALAAAGRDFAFVVPGLRGHKLVIDESSYESSGDPSDAWDGATDDALAFLNAALEELPQLDRRRVAAVGYSRGGTVALLAGIRDPRISLVLDVVGPVDHFVAMDDSLGWSTAEILADVLRDGEIPSPTEEGGQVFDHFFDRGEPLGRVRARLLASSPLYFAESLPETHAYYGSEDRSVPLPNADLLRRRMTELGRLDRDFTLRLFEGRGHDTDPLAVQRDTAARLLEWAARPRPSES